MNTNSSPEALSQDGELTALNEKEKALFLAFKNGLPNAFENIIAKYKNFVFYTAFHILRDEDKTQDAVQDIFVKIHHYLPSFRGDCKLISWIYRVSKNHCLNVLQHLYKKSELFSEEGLSEEEADHEQESPREILSKSEESRKIRKEVIHALTQLPKLQKQVFILRHFRELPFADIALALKRSLGTVKSSYFQGVRSLRNLLASKLEGIARLPIVLPLPFMFTARDAGFIDWIQSQRHLEFEMEVDLSSSMDAVTQHFVDEFARISILLQKTSPSEEFIENWTHKELENTSPSKVTQSSEEDNDEFPNNSSRRLLLATLVLVLLVSTSIVAERWYIPTTNDPIFLPPPQLPMRPEISELPMTQEIPPALQNSNHEDTPLPPPNSQPALLLNPTPALENSTPPATNSATSAITNPPPNNNLNSPFSPPNAPSRPSSSLPMPNKNSQSPTLEVNTPSTPTDLPRESNPIKEESVTPEGLEPETEEFIHGNETNIPNSNSETQHENKKDRNKKHGDSKKPKPRGTFQKAPFVDSLRETLKPSPAPRLNLKGASFANALRQRIDLSTIQTNTLLDKKTFLENHNTLRTTLQDINRNLKKNLNSKPLNEGIRINSNSIRNTHPSRLASVRENLRPAALETMNVSLNPTIENPSPAIHIAPPPQITISPAPLPNVNTPEPVSIPGTTIKPEPAPAPIPSPEIERAKPVQTEQTDFERKKDFEKSLREKTR